jgi:hypothetical protein
LVSTNKVLVIVHTLREKLDENKKPTKAFFGELIQLLCETSWWGRRWLPYNPALWMVKISLVGETDGCCHRYLPTP